MEIRALRDTDDRSLFRSDDPEIDRFFSLFAGQNQFRHHLGVSYVAIDDNRILGFATVAAGHIEIDELPIASRKKFPRYPLPVLRLARIGVDHSVQGQGVGLQLLRFVLGLALGMSRGYGCVGVIADAKSNAVAFYAKYGFIPVEAVEGGSDVRPAPMPMFLSLRAVTDAVGKRT